MPEILHCVTLTEYKELAEEREKLLETIADLREEAKYHRERVGNASYWKEQLCQMCAYYEPTLGPVCKECKQLDCKFELAPAKAKETVWKAVDSVYDSLNNLAEIIDDNIK